MTETPDPKSAHRIAVFLPHLSGGGAERVMVLLANGFVARGHQVDLVLARAEGPYLGEIAVGVRVVDLGCSRALISLWPLVLYLWRSRPNAMLSAMTHANIIAIWARKLAGVPLRLVVSEHSNPSRSLAGGGMARVMRSLIRRFYSRAYAIVCVSNGAQEEMAKMFPPLAEKLRTIYNPHDLKHIRSLMEASVDHPWLEDSNTRVILAAGRLTRAKDYPTLFRAMKQLLKRRPVRLIILGQGEEETVLRQLARDLDIAGNVDFVGFQTNPFAWMKRCDLFVLCSAWEGLPGVLIEALACGGNIVSTDCRTGPREILEDGKLGTLVPVGDPIALAEAMDEYLDKEAKDGSVSVEKFDLPHVASQYLDLLLGPISGGR